MSKPTWRPAAAAEPAPAEQSGRLHRVYTVASTAYDTSTWWGKVQSFAGRHLNFYRVHMLAFIFTPLIASAIFYASQGETELMYIDALFMCTSAMTVTGLNSVLLQSLTGWQQTILFVLMCLGSSSGVSMVTVLIRRHFFRKRFQRVVSTDPAARARISAIEAQEQQQPGDTPPLDCRQTPSTPAMGISPAGSPMPSRPTSALDNYSKEKRLAREREREREKGHEREKERAREREKEREKERSRIKKYGIKPEMVRRVDAPVRINAMSVGGYLDPEPNAAASHSPGSTNPSAIATPAESPLPSPSLERPTANLDRLDRLDGLELHDPTHLSPEVSGQSQMYQELKPEFQSVTFAPPKRIQSRRNSDTVLTTPESQAPKATMSRALTLGPHHNNELDHNTYPRTHTVEFAEPSSPRRLDPELRFRKTRTAGSANYHAPARRQSLASVAQGSQFTHTITITHSNALQSGFGGFPNPVVVAGGLGAKLLRRVVPGMDRSLTIPRSTTLQSTHSPNSEIEQQQQQRQHQIGTVKAVSYITFDATVGRNSDFRHLTTAQQEELGGVEYRAINLLIKLIAAYWLGFQLVAALILATWLTTENRYDSVFDAASLNKVWYSFFEVSSAYTNSGMSLIDASITPFQTAYVLIVVVCILILAGNTAFPIFLRILIWTLSKLAPRRSRTRETLQFLLDHPRRCFIYLFPSYQTWFLVFALVVLNCIDWISFLILDLGNPTIEDLPVGTRVLAGLLQSLAVRAAGFQIVSLSALAPAVQVLMATMMYIAIYPIALSIRSSNVYERKYLNESMGIFDEEASDDSSEEEDHARRGSAASYIAFHARKQLAFDLWWLVAAIWLICVVERTQLQREDSPYITIFSVMFECISAYGTVGLSLGLPDSATSLSGRFRVISKLIIIAVMIRGRHRGLPIALDRAVMLPSDLENHNDFPRALTRESAEGLHAERGATLSGSGRGVLDYLRAGLGTAKAGTQQPRQPEHPEVSREATDDSEKQPRLKNASATTGSRRPSEAIVH